MNKKSDYACIDRDRICVKAIVLMLLFLMLSPNVRATSYVTFNNGCL